MSDNNWKINIGTDLNTNEAKKKLDEFIKGQDKKNKIKVEVEADKKGDVDKLKSSLKDVQKTVSGTNKTKLRLGGNISDATKKLKVNMDDVSKKMGKSTQDAMKRLTEGSTKAVNETTKGMTKELTSVTKQADKLSNKFGKIDTKFLDEGQTKELDDCVKKLEKMKNVDVKSLSSEDLDKYNKELESIRNTYQKINDSAQTNKFAESFNNVKINPLLEQMESIRSVMSAKGMDLSGIDNLISRTKAITSTATTIGEMRESYATLKKELTDRITMNLDLSSVKNSESALKKLYEYKNELSNQKLRLDVDSSQMQKINTEIERTDKAIAEVQSRLGTVGQSTNLNLIDSATTKNVKDLNSELDSSVKKFQSLKAEANKLKGNEFVDISQLASLEHYVQGMESSLKMLNGNISADGVKNFNDQIKILESTVNSVKKSASTLKLEAKFNVDVGDAESKINGIHSAMVKMGNVDTGKINEWKNSLESIKGYAKINLDGAVSQLNALNNEMNNFASNNGIKNATGDMKQYIQYAKELSSTMSKSLGAKDSNVASNYEQQAERIKSAMKQLESSFKETEQASANAFKNDSFNSYANKFATEMEKVDSQLTKFKSTMANLGKTVDFSSLKGNVARGLEEEFNIITQRASELQERLRNLMASGSTDLSEINAIKDALKQLQTQADSLSKRSIVLKVQDSVNNLRNLSSEMDKLGKDTADVDALKLKFQELAKGIADGTISGEQAVKQFNTLNSSAKNMATSFQQATAGIGTFGTKIQGIFRTIGNSFSTYGLGMMISRGVTALVSNIKSTITDLDSAFTDFARVAPENFTINDSNLMQLSKDARQIAIDVGQSVEDVIHGMSTALQAGASTMEQATAIAKSSAIFQNVTDMSAENASKAVSSLINQYYSMDTALSQSTSEVGKSVKGYNNLTEAMDLLNYAG